MEEYLIGIEVTTVRFCPGAPILNMWFLNIKYEMINPGLVTEFNRWGKRCVACIPEDELEALSVPSRKTWKRIEKLYTFQKMEMEKYWESYFKKLDDEPKCSCHLCP